MNRIQKTLVWTVMWLLALHSIGAHAANELNLPANELGKVMVLMYHHIKAPEATWSRTPENFRADLELLYKKGYYLVNLVDLVEGKLKVPAGKTPVVLTFDDFAPGQIAKKDGAWDPDCAVGIINDLYEKHPDFGRAGSFYLNQRTEDPNKKSHIPQMSAMLREMVELGYELGNHTVSHPQLKDLTQREVEKEIAGIQKWIGAIIPGYIVKTMAMPFGIYPKEEAWAVDGESGGVAYHNIALLKVGSEPSVSPYSKAFKPMRISRVRASDTFDHPAEKDALAYFRNSLAYFDRHPELRWISDGNADTITVPASRKSELKTELLSKRQILTQ